MAVLNWIRDNIEMLKLAVVVVGGGLALMKYSNEQREGRRIAAREMALRHLVIDGFLVAASEF